MPRSPYANLSANTEAWILARALEMRPQDWNEVGWKLGVSGDWLRRRLDSDFAKNRNRYLRTKQTLRKKHGMNLKGKLLRDLLSTVPEDTRSWSSQHLGEPLPGRSALDRREVSSTSSYKPLRGFAIDRLNEIRSGIRRRGAA